MYLRFCFPTLFFIKLLFGGCSCCLEQLIKKNVENEIKNVIILKRQLPDLREDRKLFGDANDKNGLNTTEEFLATKKAPNHTCSCRKHQQDQRRKITSKPDKKSPIKYQFNKIKQSTEIKQNVKETDDVKDEFDEEKNQYHTNNHSDTLTASMFDLSGSSRPKQPEKTMPVTTLTPATANIAELQRARYDIKEIEFQIDRTIRELCPNYKDVPELDVQSMTDMWQLIYYKAEEQLTCFKIFLKNITPQSKIRYEDKYSNFKESIIWEDCYLELSSTRKQRDDRKHFLQGVKTDKGILNNIIISEDVEDGNKIITMQGQTPNQWLVKSDLLLMRDCESGDVVVFFRVPMKPSWREVEDAMTIFGENGLNETVACDNMHKDNMNSEEDLFINKKYHILS